MRRCLAGSELMMDRTRMADRHQAFLTSAPRSSQLDDAKSLIAKRHPSKRLGTRILTSLRPGPAPRPHRLVSMRSSADGASGGRRRRAVSANT